MTSELTSGGAAGSFPTHAQVVVGGGGIVGCSVAYPWGSKTQIRSRSDAVVLVDEAAEHVAVANVARADGQRVLGVGRRSREVEGTMRPPAVVVVGIRPKRPIEVPPTEDERPIQALGPDRRDDPFGVGIGIGSPDRGEDHPGALRADHRVERSAELRVAVVDEEPNRR